MALLVFVVLTLLNLEIQNTRLVLSAAHDKPCKLGDFYCRADKSCISGNKVCNFVNDCSDGQDEARCGGCNFSIPLSSCGLVPKHDKVFGWQVKSLPILVHAGTKTEPQHYLTTEILPQMRQYTARMHLHPEAIFKPKVVFPTLQSTNNQKCRLSLRVQVSEHPPIVFLRPEPSPTHPKIYVYTISYVYSEKSKRRVRNYMVHQLNIDQRGVWKPVEVPLLESRTGFTWSVEIVTEMRIDAYQIYIADIEFLDCQPEKGAQIKVPPENSEQVSEPECNSDEFRCEVSRICIPQSLVCDYGYDCGDEDDRSDEEHCEDHPGRCDFEDQGWCSWIASPREDAWKHMSALVDDQKMYGDRPRPPVDHTFRSAERGGKYLMLNTEAMHTSSQSRLIGPKVEIQDNQHECWMRFWVYVPDNYAGPKLDKVYLFVDNQELAYDDLISEHRAMTMTPIPGLLPGEISNADNRNWHRHEILLLTDELYDHRLIYSLHVTFGNLLDKLESFKDNNGYIALDDFSFSTGCKLSFLAESADTACDESQFFCIIPTPLTKSTCIPMDYYCDFKNDCGRIALSYDLTSDERDCPHKCRLDELDHLGHPPHCGFEMLDINKLQLEGDILANEELVSDNFLWAPPSSSKLYLDIQVSGNLIGTDENLDSVEEQNIYSPSSLDMRLPKFSQAHGNCTFELTYMWSEESIGISASIELVGELQEVFIKEIPARQTDTDWHTLHVGLGHQMQPFNLLIKTKMNLQNLEPQTSKGRLMIKSYEFISCNFFHGLINDTRRVHYESSGEEEDYIGRADYLDYPIPPKDEQKLIGRCAVGFFQCEQPIVCIPDNLLCDLQRDCQNGRDESMNICYQTERFTFDLNEDQVQEIWSQGWSTDGGWLLMSSAERPWLRRSLDTGPPADHTLSHPELGLYLAMGSGLESNSSQPVREMNLKSKNFEMVDEIQCRVVFYVYLWGVNTQRLRVYQMPLHKPDAALQIALLDKQRDAWQRVELLLTPQLENQIEQRYALVFQGVTGSGPADMIAIDDVSFGKGCKMTLSDSSLEESDTWPLFEGRSSDRVSHATSWLIWSLALLLFAAGAFTFFSRPKLAERGLGWVRRKRTEPLVSRPIASGLFVLDNLERLGRQSWHSSKENLVESSAAKRG